MDDKLYHDRVVLEPKEVLTYSIPLGTDSFKKNI